MNKVKSKIRRPKSPERVEELKLRKERQLSRKSTFTHSVTSADINSKTGQPHEHKRQKERNLSNAKFVTTKA